MPIVYGEPGVKYYQTEYKTTTAMPGETKLSGEVIIRTNVAELEQIPVRVVIAAKMGGTTTCTVEALDKNDNVITSMSLDSGSNTLLAYRGAEITFDKLPVKVRVANDSSSETGVTAAITAYPYSWDIRYGFKFNKLTSKYIVYTLSNGSTHWVDVGAKIVIAPPNAGWGIVYIEKETSLPGMLYPYQAGYTTGTAQQPGSYYLQMFEQYVMWV